MANYEQFSFEDAVGLFAERANSFLGANRRVASDGFQAVAERNMATMTSSEPWGTLDFSARNSADSGGSSLVIFTRFNQGFN